LSMLKLVDEFDHVVVAAHAITGIDDTYLPRAVAEVVGGPVDIPGDLAEASWLTGATTRTGSER
jgi:hypothetical protein